MGSFVDRVVQLLASVLTAESQRPRLARQTLSKKQLWPR